MNDDEVAARKEVEDIDALVREASETIKKLNKRRQEILPVAERTTRHIAALLHAENCKQGHGSTTNNGCKWERNRGTWSNDDQKRWLTEARDKVRNSGASEDDVLAALLVITPKFRADYAAEDTKWSDR